MGLEIAKQDRMTMLKYILGFLLVAGGIVWLILVVPFSVFSGSPGVIVGLAVLGIIALAIGSWLIKHH